MDKNLLTHISYGPSEHALRHFYVTHSDSWTANPTRTWQLRKQHRLFWFIVSIFQHNQLCDGSHQMSGLSTDPSTPHQTISSHLCVLN